MIPQYWLDFVKANNLIGSYIEIPEERDLSGLGIEMKIMDEKSIIEEAQELYPGLVVLKDNFIPVGECQLGSGDPYFINQNDGINGPIYRIYHDVVFDEDYDKEEAIDKVLESYTELITNKA